MSEISFSTSLQQKSVVLGLPGPTTVSLYSTIALYPVDFIISSQIVLQIFLRSLILYPLAIARSDLNFSNGWITDELKTFRLCLYYVL